MTGTLAFTFILNLERYDYKVNGVSRSLFYLVRRVPRLRTTSHRWQAARPYIYGYTKRQSKVTAFLYMERMMGIEPTTAAWEAAVLPLNYIRTNNIYIIILICRLQAKYRSIVFFTSLFYLYKYASSYRLFVRFVRYCYKGIYYDYGK